MDVAFSFSNCTGKLTYQQQVEKNTNVESELETLEVEYTVVPKTISCIFVFEDIEGINVDHWNTLLTNNEKENEYIIKPSDVVSYKMYDNDKKIMEYIKGTGHELFNKKNCEEIKKRLQNKKIEFKIVHFKMKKKTFQIKNIEYIKGINFDKCPTD